MTECFESLDQPIGCTKHIAAVEIVSAEFLVRGAAFEQMIADRENCAGHSYDGPLGSAKCGEASKLG